MGDRKLSRRVIVLYSCLVNLWYPFWLPTSTFGSQIVEIFLLAVLCLVYDLANTAQMKGFQMNKEEKADGRLSLRVTKSMKDAFKEKADELGKTESQVLMMLVTQFIGQGIQPTDDIDSRFRKLEEEIATIKQAHLGELIASEMKIAS